MAYKQDIDDYRESPAIKSRMKAHFHSHIGMRRAMTGATNCRAAAPGTIRGDMGMSGQENIIHASDTPENAVIEVKRFFRDDEIFEYTPAIMGSIYAADELA